MSKLIVYNMVSVDGYFARPDGNIDWHNVDDEFNKFAIEQLNGFDTIVFGRKTYQLFESYWPAALKDPQTVVDDRTIAQAITDARKVVFSKSLKETHWNNVQLEHDLTEGVISKLKDTAQKDIVIYGSGEICSQLTKMNLIDEYRLIVAPVVLGEGRSMLAGAGQHKLKLIEARPFKSGNVLLVYSPAS